MSAAPAFEMKLTRAGAGEHAVLAATVTEVATGRELDPVEVTAGTVAAAAARLAGMMPGASVDKVAAELTEALAADLEDRPVSAGELLDRFPDLRPVTIQGIARLGEVVNIIAAPKMRKSYAVLELAVAGVVGGVWLGRFEVTAGRVLVIDNELHGETLASRLRVVTEGMGVPPDRLAGLDFYTLRGRLKDIDRLNRWLARTVRWGTYSLIVVDALYRVMPAGPSQGGENDNAAMAQVYNTLDRIADVMGCTVVVVHHSSKGVQGSKGVTDVGAGAGSQSRAADAHLVLREHEEADVAVLDGVVRSFPPPGAVGLRWRYPRWVHDPMVDVARLKRERGPGGRPPKGERKAAAEPEAEWTPETFASTFVTPEAKAKLKILDRAVTKTAGMKKLTGRAAERLMRLAEDAGLIHSYSYPKDKGVYYATVPQSVSQTTNL